MRARMASAALASSLNLAGIELLVLHAMRLWRMGSATSVPLIFIATWAGRPAPGALPA
jgi:hypothetical protein